jgi:predicted component of type VI protein secretion system
MLDDELMHWEEGLYIQPQHLQTLQRQALQRAAVERRLLTPFPYGVVRAELDRNALSIQGGARVEYRELHVVMRNGWVVEQGRNATVRPLQFSGELGGDARLTVYLVVRKWQQGAAVISNNGHGDGNGTGPDIAAASPGAVLRGSNGASDDGTLFRLTRHTEVSDENTGTDRADITTRRYDARLIVVGPGDAWPDQTTWEALPVLRLIGTNPPRVDEDFAPPCFHLKGWRELEAAVERIAQATAAKRHEITSKAGAVGVNPTRADVEQMLRFQAMTVHGAALSHALKNASLSAYAAYGYCLRLLGALQGARFGSEPVESEYEHEDPWPAFESLLNGIMGEVKFDPEEARGYMLAPMGGDFGAIQACTGDFNLVRDKGWSCTLAVAADTSEEVARVVGSQMIHVGSPRALKAAKRAFYIPWAEDSAVGLKPIHREGGATRFLSLRINPKDPHWGYVLQETRLAVIYANVAGESHVQLRFKLYMRPPAGV